PTDSPAEQLVAAMLDTVAERGWRAVSLEDVGARAGMSAAETHALCADRAQLLDLFARQTDAAAVAGVGPVPDDAEARY
ncbi:MAG: hypothetical protein JJ899_16605, partial [Alphaproteobacteria bacterium]|nr:hypothetical protein [Alphaproteobacteria bacterium]